MRVLASRLPDKVKPPFPSLDMGVCHILELSNVNSCCEVAYFTCSATNSAQRISSFLPVDFSNNSVCSIRRMPWSAKRREKPYFTCVATNSAQRTSSFLPVDFSNSSVCSIRRMPLVTKKKKKTYFICVATNSAQRISNFLPVDFSNNSSEYARVFIALSSVRTKPWSYLWVK